MQMDRRKVLFWQLTSSPESWAGTVLAAITPDLFPLISSYYKRGLPFQYIPTDNKNSLHFRRSNLFQVFIFDYSGFGFSEGKATRKQVLSDANAALNYIKGREDVKGTKLVIYGQSLGGHLSAVVAAQRQEEIDGLVIEGAFSSHKDIAAENAGFFGRLLVCEQYSASESIRNYKKPVLIIHSTEDDIIPFEMGKKLFDNANNPKEFYEIKHCHMCGPDFYAESIAQKIKKMVGKE